MLPLARRRPRALPILVLTLLAPVLLAACGYQPLYRGANPGDPDLIAQSPVATRLAAIRVGQIPDRPGQILYNELQRRLHANGAVPPTLDLAVTLQEERIDLGIDKDDSTSRAQLIQRARFVLTERATGTVLTRGQARAVASYNVQDNPFAATFNRDSAREEALEELARTISVRLALALSGADDGDP